MRPDMAKLIVEPPRRNSVSKLRSKERYNVPLAIQEPMRTRGINRKERSDNLNPLRKYLLAQIGRPWANIWHEICEQCDKRNTIQRRVLEHVGDFVAINVSEINDRLYHEYGELNTDRWFGRRELYVCPNTGLLKAFKNPYTKLKYRNRLKKPVIFWGRYFYPIDGIWYEFSWDYIKYHTHQRLYIDSFTGEKEWHIGSEALGYDVLAKCMVKDIKITEISGYSLPLGYGTNFYFYKKSQCNKKIIREIKKRDK